MGHQAEGSALNKGLPGLPGCGLWGSRCAGGLALPNARSVAVWTRTRRRGKGVMGNEDLGEAGCQRESLGWALKEEEEFKG